jgi:hypothetical protein
MDKNQITKLPLTAKDRNEFIETANRAFEDIFETMEPRSPEETRRLWNVEQYVDDLLHEDMLPISRDYALSLIEPFLAGYIASLAAEADKNMKLPPMDVSWFLDGFLDSDDSDLEDPAGQPILSCDIEINNEICKTHKEVLSSTAEALRNLASQIETGKLEDGFHPIKTPNGDIIGEMYLDHCEMITL